MAIDGEPAEPFPARNGALVLAPGGRADAFVDTAATASLLLHDGTEAHQIGRLVISGYRERRAPLLPASPLPSNGLPAQLDLRNSLRFDLPSGGPNDWVSPASFKASSPPAFRAKVGHTVGLTLTNRNAIATVFHLHGHHFRLLDRLDDGWKPFWLATALVEAKQTARIAFLADRPGKWLIECVGIGHPRSVMAGWFEVT